MLDYLFLSIFCLAHSEKELLRLRPGRESMEEALRNRLAELNKASDQNDEAPVQGTLKIMYERLGDFQWFPDRGDRARFREFKHWKLWIQLGEDEITVEFLENSIFSRQGHLLVKPLKSSYAGKTYTLGDLTLCPRTLYKDLLHCLYEWTDYNIQSRNCQHFVNEFLANLYESLSNRTKHCEELTVIGPRKSEVFLRARFASLFDKFGSRSKS